MQKFTLLICSLCAVVVLGIGLTSCKDDEPFVKPNLSVSSETLSVNESAGTIEVEIVLDKGAPADITIEYNLGGSAISPADYSIVGKEGEIEIAQGQTSATIQIQIVNDASYEGNETIEVSLDDVDSDDVVITNDDETVITITDDDPQVTASFDVTTMTVNEADGIVEVSVKLSQAATSNTTLQYTLSGSARDSVTARSADPVLPADYSIWGGNSGTLQIASGQNSGVIRLGLYSDFIIEDGNPDTAPWDPETIIITLTQASAGVQIAADKDEIQIGVNQEDGKVIALFWGEEGVASTVDMDLFLWIGDIGDDVADLGLIALSAFEGTEAPEVVFIPAKINDVKFGVTYLYYEGDVDPLEFESHFIDFADGAIGDREIYKNDVPYTLANINEWTTFDDLVNIEQTFEIDANGAYTNISTISTPTTGSRAPMYKIPAGTVKSKVKQPGLRKFSK
ncbi:Calx-beta domain-containing protein [Chryseolinea sp. H1M3-3]|uniref:Calx-beta domain-containing protein n=1 Tax=Chryseolinea sp. H1M3-3 TaxID=3034144 RepID=UPI0023EB48AB|nr:Calx-beta domain-containing protein [Chryseolinea sp. H1M3-3]